jgi:hypothetical protein
MNYLKESLIACRFYESGPDLLSEYSASLFFVSKGIYEAANTVEMRGQLSFGKIP